MATQRGWRIHGEYADEGISGSQDSRPELDRLMADARGGRLDLVVVWKFDRFARSTRHLLMALEEFRLLGVDFVSLREQIDTSTPMGRAVFTIIAAVAELERELIRERVVAGVRRAQAAGKHCGRPRKEVTDKALDAAQALLGQGWSWRAVAEATGIHKDTLRRRLKETEEVSHNPPPEQQG